MRRKRICLIDELEVVRQGLVLVLERHKGLEVCCQASEPANALRCLADHAHDVLVTDLFVQGAGGLALIKRVRLEYPSLPILVLSAKEEPLYAARSFSAGATGYLSKRDRAEVLWDAVDSVVAGNRYLPASLRAHFANHPGRGTENEETGFMVSLSDRELEVFHYIGAGLKTTEIAEALHVSRKTVETYRARIKEKLMLPNGNLLARCAMEWALQ